LIENKQGVIDNIVQQKQINKRLIAIFSFSLNVDILEVYKFLNI